MNELPIPEVASRDQKSLEVGRIWIAERKLHCSLRVGLYKDKANVSEEKAWGIILADITKHIAQALHKEFGRNEDAAVKKIFDSFHSEVVRPTSKAKGDFV